MEVWIPAFAGMTDLATVIAGSASDAAIQSRPLDGFAWLAMTEKTLPGNGEGFCLTVSSCEPARLRRIFPIPQGDSGHAARPGMTEPYAAFFAAPVSFRSWTSLLVTVVRFSTGCFADLAA